MKKISVWANRHKWQARIILVIAIFLLSGAGIASGLLLKDISVVIPSSLLLLFVLIYFTGLVLYPAQAARNRLGSSLFYRQQKMADIILAASAFLLFVCISNDASPSKILFPGFQPASASIPVSVADSTVRAYKTFAEFSKQMKDENGKQLQWKERKKLLKQQVKAIRQANDMSRGEKTVLIILSVLLAMGLIFLIAGLSCSLSCSGAEGAAIVLALGGTALIVFLLILAIRSINNKGRKKRLREEKTKEASGA